MNPHGFPHTPLKRARLPIPPSRQVEVGCFRLFSQSNRRHELYGRARTVSTCVESSHPAIHPWTAKSAGSFDSAQDGVTSGYGGWLHHRRVGLACGIEIIICILSESVSTGVVIKTIFTLSSLSRIRIRKPVVLSRAEIGALSPGKFKSVAIRGWDGEQKHEFDTNDAPAASLTTIRLLAPSPCVGSRLKRCSRYHRAAFATRPGRSRPRALPGRSQPPPMASTPPRIAPAAPHAPSSIPGRPPRPRASAFPTALRHPAGSVRGLSRPGRGNARATRSHFTASPAAGGLRHRGSLP